MEKNNTQNTEAKPFWKSKTVWMNIAAVIADAATLFASGGTITAISVANIVLRAITKTPVKAG